MAARKANYRTGNASRLILIAFAIAYMILGTIDSYGRKITAIDSFTAVIVIAILFAISPRYRISPINSVLAGFAFLPNLIGHHGAYGWSALNGHYDWFVHLSVALASVQFFASFLQDNRVADRRNAIIFAFLITITLGALVETMEYWGFIFYGFGDGYLGFGSGDNSKNFGPWENSSIDLTVNFIGAGLGAALYSLARKKTRHR